MIDEIWKHIKNEHIHIDTENEIGYNICYDGNTIHLADYQLGKPKSVCLPYNPFTIGSFHTHIYSKGSNAFQFSKTDIKSSIMTGEQYIFLGIDEEVYGVDLKKYERYVEMYRNKKINLYKLTRIINDGMKEFDY